MGRLSRPQRRNAKTALTYPLHLARALGLVDAERVHFNLGGARVGEATLRRDRDGHFVGGNEDRLPELPIPGAELLLDALEGSELELGAVDESRHSGKILIGFAGHRLADRARGDIGLIVDGQHQAVEVLGEIVVGLGRAPFFVPPAPGRCDQASGARDRARLTSLASVENGLFLHASRTITFN